MFAAWTVLAVAGSDTLRKRTAIEWARRIRRTLPQWNERTEDTDGAAWRQGLAAGEEQAEQGQFQQKK